MKTGNHHLFYMRVELIKLATLETPLPGSQLTKQMALCVDDAGPVYDWYLSILRKNSPDMDFFFRKKVLPDDRFLGRLNLQTDTGYSYKGKFHSEPVVGQALVLDSGGWMTSTILSIIEDSIIITRNSIWAIHSPQKMREGKLGELGL